MNQMTTIRTFGALVASISTALALLIAVELFSSIVHPPPADFKGTKEEICELVATYPHWVLALVVPMWGFAAFICTWIAGRLGNRSCAAFIGLLFVALVICNIVMLPYTAWFKVLMPIVAFIAAGFGYALSPSQTTETVPTTNECE